MQQAKTVCAAELRIASIVNAWEMVAPVPFHA
jgi:hypothetical protein